MVRQMFEKKLEQMSKEQLNEYVRTLESSVMALETKIHAMSAENMPITSDAAIVDGKSILAVDDTKFFLLTLKSLLQNTEYKLTCTTSGTKALKFLEKHSPDLFILDIDMPEMDGYELALKIRAGGHKAPIIFLTGNSTRESVEKAIRVGVSDFILKPIIREQVIERIVKFI